MSDKNRKFSIKTKMYIFVVLTAFAVAAGTAAIAYITSSHQIDRYYKKSTADNARNMAAEVDGDFLRELRAAIESDEYQEIREKAEAEENEQLIEDYLRENGFWDEYYNIRMRLSHYVDNMEEIKYMYVVAHGGANDDYDMYLIDDEDTDLYETGYYEEREAELRGVDLENMTEPRISNGDWGYLCSAFSPVYDSNGECVCIVGCDFGMDEVMQERMKLLAYLIVGAFLFTAIVQICAMLFINKIVIKPINMMTKELKKFTPSEYEDTEKAGVMNLDIHSHDEIAEIYNGIKTMETDIIDYLKNMSKLEKDKKKAEDDIRDKDEEIGRLNIETYRDALTGVGNKAAYVREVEKLNRDIQEHNAEFALVMVDMNNLKQINDDFGHKSGDQYIRGCCHLACDIFKHSPVFRIGGDEFVVVLRGQDYENRKELTEQLKKQYEESYGLVDKKPWHRYSAAVGMAENASDDITVELVFKRADKAMYADKAKFKNEHGGYR